MIVALCFNLLQPMISNILSLLWFLATLPLQAAFLVYLLVMHKRKGPRVFSNRMQTEEGLQQSEQS